MLIGNLDYFRAKPMNIPKITILLDHGYHPHGLVETLEQEYPQMMNKIQVRARAEALEGRKGRGRQNRLGPHCHALGD